MINQFMFNNAAHKNAEYNFNSVAHSTKHSFNSLLTRALTLCAALLVLTSACRSPEEETGPDLESETHWLRFCDETAPCGSGFACICGACSRACDSSAACTALSGAARCLSQAEVNSCETPAADSALCVLPCTNDTQCTNIASFLTCRSGQCADSRTQLRPPVASPMPIVCEHRGSGTLYDVGPGKPLETLSSVPWDALGAGDTVRIHWRPEPYAEKILITGVGTEAQPIVICGVASALGVLPTLSAQNATSAPHAGWTDDPFNWPYGLITVEQSDVEQPKPAYIEIAGLRITGAASGATFTDPSGAQQTYSDNAAAVLIKGADHITVRGNLIDDSIIGLLARTSRQDSARLSSDLLVEGNLFKNNGKIDAYEGDHIDSEVNQITIQFNWFSQCKLGAHCDVIEDRSAGTVIRYNWIESGDLMLALLDAQEAESLWEEPSYREALVYGNVFYNHPHPESSGGGDGLTSTILWYGGSTWGEDREDTRYRQGTLWFFNNTILVEADRAQRYQVRLLKMTSSAESAQVLNNAFYFTQHTPGEDLPYFEIAAANGLISMGVNWSNAEIEIPQGFLGQVTGLERALRGVSPGWGPLGRFDLRPRVGSALLGVGEVVTKGELTHEFNPFLGGIVERIGVSGDLGAFSRAPSE